MFNYSQDAFRLFPCLQTIRTEEWEQTNHKISEIPTGTVLFIEGDVPSFVPFILKGAIRIYKMGTNGRELTLYRVKPGQSCTLILTSLLSGSGFPAFAITDETTQILAIPVHSFRQWMLSNTSIQQFTYQLISERFLTVMTLLDEIVFKKMDQRIVEFLIQKVTIGNPTLRITHDELAVELGTAREVVSRVLKSLESRGMLRVTRGHIHILKLDDLQKTL